MYFSLISSRQIFIVLLLFPFCAICQDIQVTSGNSVISFNSTDWNYLDSVYLFEAPVKVVESKKIPEFIGNIDYKLKATIGPFNLKQLANQECQQVKNSYKSLGKNKIVVQNDLNSDISTCVVSYEQNDEIITQILYLSSLSKNTKSYFINSLLFKGPLESKKEINQEIKKIVKGIKI